MRRIITILYLSVSASGFAQWNISNPPHIYYNDGNIGIGTTSPLQKLDLRGNLIMESGGNPILYTGTGGVELNRYLALINSPNSGSASGLKAGGILISDSYAYANPGKNDLIVKGNVGIGTSNPSSKFDMTGGSGTMNKLHISNAAVGLDGGYFDINMGTGDNYAAGMRAYVPSNQPGIDRVYLGFYTTTYENGLQSRIERLTITDAGNVGIGTSTPTAKFEVNSAKDASLLYVRQGKNNGGTSDAFFFRDDRGYSGNNTGTTFKIESWKGGGIQTGGTLANFITINDGVPTSRLIIDNTTGNVGIGTATPNAKLHIPNGSAIIGGDASLNPVNSNGTLTVISRDNNNTTYPFYVGQPGGSDIFWVRGNGNGYFLGNIGIGTTTPDAKLAVKGDIHTQEVRVDLEGWSDFVFEKEYILPTLAEVEQHIQANGHLPGIPSAAEVAEHGVKLGEMNAKLLQKIEELTLYIIEQNKRIEKHQKELEELKRNK